MTELDKAYIAGLIDGEGSIVIGRRKTMGANGASEVYHVRLAIAMSSESVIHWLYETIGVGSYLKRHPPKAKHALWTWVVTSHKAKTVLEEVLPYLRLKAPQAELAIKYVKQFGTPFRAGPTPEPKERRNEKHTFYIAMKALNQGNYGAINANS